jgi:hypothetical protein
MKKLICFLAISLALSSCAGNVETREEATVSQDLTDNCDNTAVSAKVQKVYLLQTINDFTPEEAQNWLQEYERGTLPMQGLTGFEVDTTYNGHCILGISYLIEWMGAYPSSHRGYVNYNLKTGDTLLMQDVVADGKMHALFQLCNQKLKQNIDDNRKQLVAGDGLEDAEWHIKEYPPMFTTDNINNFYISNEGVTFRYEFDFPHVMQGMEPDGEISVSKDELRSLLNTNGPLRFLIK